MELISIIAFISLYRFLDKRPKEDELVVSKTQFEEEMYNFYEK